jgi:PST family polysaccharide transporter
LSTAEPQRDTHAGAPHVDAAHGGGGAGPLVRALLSTSTGNAGQQALSLAITFALASLLAPDQFGTVATVGSVLTLGTLLVDQGLGTAVVQKRDLRDEHLDACFWLTLGIGLISGLCMLMLAGPFAILTGMPGVESLTRVLWIVLPIQGLTIVQQALLRRQMRFGALAMRGLAATAAGGVAGVTLAALGAGVWALAGQLLADAVVGLALLWHASTWRPRARVRLAPARELLHTSGFVLLTSLGTYMTRRADALLLALFLPPAAIGLFRMGVRLKDSVMMLTMRPVQAVALSVLAPVAHDMPRLHATARRLITASLLASLPLLGWMAAASPWTLALLGEAWVPALRAVQILAIWGALEAVTTFADSLLIARGRPGIPAAIVWSSGIASVGAMLCAAWLTRHESAGVQAASVALSRAVLHSITVLPLTLFVLARHAGLTPSQILGRARVPLLCAGSAAACAVVLARVIPPEIGWRHAYVSIPAILLVGMCAVLPLPLDPVARSVARALVRRVRSRLSVHAGTAGEA